MDPRSLLPLVPGMFRGVLTALLDRLEAVERELAELKRGS